MPALPSAPFISAKSLYAGVSIIQLKLNSKPALTGVTATAADEIFTKTAHGLAEAQGVIFVSGTGFTGITAGTRYYVKYLSSSTFSLSLTPGGAVIALSLDGSAGVFQPLFIFETRKVVHKGNQEEATLERPGSDKVNYEVRSVVKKRGEQWISEMDEAKRLLEIFSGSLMGRVLGTATIWSCDPDDATDYAALKSEDDFSVTVLRDGDLTNGDGDFTKPSILIKSNKQGLTTWTADAAA